MVLARADRAVGRRASGEAVGVALTVAVLVLLPVARRRVLWTPPEPVDDFSQLVAITSLDVPLAALIAYHLISFVRSSRGSPRDPRRWSGPLQAAALLILWLMVATLVHPSWRAASVAFHVAGVWAIVRSARLASAKGRTVFLGAIATVGVVQAILGIVQSRLHRPIGANLIEYSAPLLRFGEAAAAQGSFLHPYHLATLLVAALGACGLLMMRQPTGSRAVTVVAVAVMGTAVLLTFSRAALLGVVPLLFVWLRRRPTRVLAPALVAGISVGALLGVSGVDAKASKFESRTNFDSGRIQLARDALDLVANEPLFGVGPGRYVLELQANPPSSGLIWPPHNVILHTTAESGIVGGVLIALSLGAFCCWAARRSATALGIAMALLPFHLLDAYPHVLATGFVVSAMWLGTVSIAVADEQPWRTQESATAPGLRQPQDPVRPLNRRQSKAEVSSHHT